MQDTSRPKTEGAPLKKQLVPILLVLCIAAIAGSTASIQMSAAAPRFDPSTVTQRMSLATPVLDRDQPTGAGPWVVRAFYDDRQMVNDLAAWREPWEVHHTEGYLVLDVDRSEFARLSAAGFQLVIDEEMTARLGRRSTWLPNQMAGIPGYPCFDTVEETFVLAKTIAAEHPNLATWIDIGDSWEKSAFGAGAGYDMMVLRLTNAAVPRPKPKLFVMSSVHAREYAPAALNTHFAQYLVDNYGVDADVTWLLDYHEIHLLLHANPDGRKYAELRLLWRKNTDNNYCTNTVARGADINRNFEFQWSCCGGSSGDPCAETYRGPNPASEPETQAIQNYVSAVFPDQRGEELASAAPITATGVFVDLHSYSELVLWPWGFTFDTAPNGTALQTLGRKLAFLNGYEPAQAIELYPTDGTTDDFAYGELGVAAYTFEVGNTFFQDCNTFENEILPDNLAALIYVAKVARTPYITPAGPDVLALTLAPQLVGPGDFVRLHATIDDTRFSVRNGTEPSQSIAGAEYYIDVPPWAKATTPVPSALVPEDGAFDETREAVTALIGTSGLSGGQHIIFVRGQDADGNWGAFSAVFVDIATLPRAEFSTNSPVPVGTPTILVNQTIGLQPLEFLWDFGDGEGRSTLENPSYTYRATGTFTITLTATNSLGSDRISHPVAIVPDPLNERFYLQIIVKSN